MRIVERVTSGVTSWPPAKTALEVNGRAGELGGGFLASAVTLSMFLSLFPLMLVTIAVLGFVSAGDDSLASDLISNLGLTGDTAEFLVEALESAEEGRAGASVIGFGGLVWTTLGVVGAIGHVCDRAWQVPSRGLIGKLVSLSWLLGFLVMLGGSIALTALLTVLPSWLAPLQVIGGLFLLVGFFLFTFRVLTSKQLPLSDHLPGAIVAGLGFHVLTIVAAFVVPRQAATSSALYGSIGVVFALLAWLLLFGRLLVYAAVLNVVLHEHNHGTVTVEVEAPRFEGEVPVTGDRSATVQEREPVKH